MAVCEENGASDDLPQRVAAPTVGKFGPNSLLSSDLHQAGSFHTPSLAE